jgi:hypothetical protein
VTDRRGFSVDRLAYARAVVRSFSWWFGMGAVLTLSVLMVQGGVRDLFDGAHPSFGTSPYVSFSTTIFGGGLLAGCLALVMKRIR